MGSDPQIVVAYRRAGGGKGRPDPSVVSAGRFRLILSLAPRQPG